MLPLCARMRREGVGDSLDFGTGFEWMVGWIVEAGGCV